MKLKFDIFKSENMLMSVMGHMVVLAVMVTSFAVFTERAKLVAPDRIQIYEIDLDAVRVSGDETRLHNVNADTAPTPDAPAPKPEPKPEPVPAPVPDATPLETPSLVDVPDEKPEPKPEPQKSDTKNPDDSPAPRKKTVIRVNREVVSLDRTLTISVVDALRVAMTRCWAIDTSRPGLDNIRAVAHLTMRRNGTVRDVWFESAARADSDPAFAYVLDTIRNAINTCQPFRMLPTGEYAKWEKIQLTFYPTQGKVM